MSLYDILKNNRPETSSLSQRIEAPRTLEDLNESEVPRTLTDLKDSNDSAPRELIKARQKSKKRGSEISFHPTIHGNWMGELQKIVFLLTSIQEDSKKPISVVFSGLEKGIGATTISYLTSYVYASDWQSRNVLYVYMNGEDSKGGEMFSNYNSVHIGEQNFDTVFADPQHLDIIRLVKSREGESTPYNWYHNFIQEAKLYYDAVIIDTQPFYSSKESYGIARASDGVVLVLKSGQTRAPAINKMTDDLETMGIDVWGGIINFRQYPIPRWLLRLL